MGIARSTCYRASKGSADDTALVEAMHAIEDEFEAYGWRRMQAALRHRGWIVNHKKIKRLMREHALHPPHRRRFVATTDSNHDEPVFPDRTRERKVDCPTQIWVADLTYIAILGGLVYLAAIMEAWSRRIVGYALGRRIDARLTLAALTTAIEGRHPPPGCVHHSDRGTQYAAQAYRALLDEHGLVGSMGRRGNPYDNAMMESFMKTLKVEGVYPMAFESAKAGAVQPEPLHRQQQRETPTLGPRIPEPQPLRGGTAPHPGQNRRLKLSDPRGPLQKGVNIPRRMTSRAIFAFSSPENLRRLLLICIPPSDGGIHLIDLSDFPGPPQPIVGPPIVHFDGGPIHGRQVMA